MKYVLSTFGVRIVCTEEDWNRMDQDIRQDIRDVAEAAMIGMEEVICQKVNSAITKAGIAPLEIEVIPGNVMW